MNDSVLAGRNGERPKHNDLARIQAVIVSTVLFLLMISAMAADAWSADTNSLVIDIDPVQLNIYLSSSLKFNNIAIGGSFFMGNYPSNDYWEVKQYTLTQYHVRHKSWVNFFWNIDCEQKKIWRMKGVDLKDSGSEPKLLEDVTVSVKKITRPRDGSFWPKVEEVSLKLLNNTKDVKKNEDPFQTIMITLNILTPRLFLDPQNGAVCVVAGGAVVSNADAWETRRVSRDIYHFRFKQRQQSVKDFWQIDLSSMTANMVVGDNFGFTGGRTSGISTNVHRQDLNSLLAQSDIPADLTMAHYTGNHPKSAWMESEKALNAAVLSRNSYDILVVPFQVGGYAIDRVDRSLMTRYLAREIEISSKMKLPSPTLVARALGDVSRTFDDSDVFQLANKLGVKQIIRGYVGHDLNEKMSVTLVVQTRKGQEDFSQSTKTVKYSWNDIAISDERTPGEAFLSILHDVSARLQLPKVKKDAAMQREDPPALPAGIKGLVVNSSSSPVVWAYYLQLLGMLYPEQSAAKEQLFERSLVALRELSSQSPAYNILKARALFYLYRRPAAVAILGSPKDAEEKALSAVMDGNLQLLDKSIKDIKGALPQLIAQIEHSDLLWRYSHDQARTESINSFIRQWPGWEKILARRLSQRDGWNIQSNLEVKKELDRIFPITGFTAEDIVKSKMAIGELPRDDDDVDFSVYNHYRRMMENQPEKLAGNESAGIVDRDILDLMVAMGESNLVKQIELRQMQGLYDEMIKLVDRYNTVYVGHPEMAFLKALALFQTAHSKQGSAQKNIVEEASQIQHNICYWSQGQTEVSVQRSCAGLNYYDADYPRRWDWEFSRDPKDLADRKYRGAQEIIQRGNVGITPFDRKELVNYELSLLYTETDFPVLSSYYDKLRELHMYDEAAVLLEKNKQRFVGNPARTKFLARIAEKEGDVKRARSIYEEAIALQPNDWAPYAGLSWLLIRQGDYKTASKIALKYPLFSIRGDERENPGIDTVALSNYAYDIGRGLWWSGAEEAKPLLQLSAGYDTGSEAEMISIYFLALLDHDFNKAAQMSLAEAKRYKGSGSYGDYMMLLHVMGYHDEAWSVLSQVGGLGYGKVPVLLGLRMEGKTTDEQILWLKKQQMNTLTSSSGENADDFVFSVYTLDRKPDTDLSKKLQTVRDQIEKSRTGPKAPAPQKIKQPPPIPGMPNEEFMKKRFGDPILTFSDGYVFLKKKQFSDAYEKLKERFLGDWIRKDMLSCAIPYLTWSAVKRGKASEVEPYLAEYKKELGEDFDYYLSQAFLSEGKGNHQMAIRNLEFAQYHWGYFNGKRLLPIWYQLAEICEWLYEDSKFEGYRDLLLKIVRLSQTSNPMNSWAYAFEAKYTKSDADCTRALAMALYLDKQSERIAHFSKEQKSKALDWLKKNNPFLQSVQKSQQRDI